MHIQGPEYLTEIAEFFAETLKVARFKLEIEIATEIDQPSECQQFSDGSFKIIIEAGVDLMAQTEHLAHEMIHLKQYKRDELVMSDEGVTFWKGKAHVQGEYGSDEYFLSPWEMEARALEDWLTYRWENR